ncbi:MAG: YbjN domain-containing protein [Candidatus Paceibacterota bacterium]
MTGQIPESHVDTSTEAPLDVVEQIAEFNEWEFNRRNNDEIVVQAQGRYCDYSMYFAWTPDEKALHFTCALDIRVPENNLGTLCELVVRINQKLWLGHFEIWLEEGIPMYRHTFLLRGVQGAPLQIEQAEDVIGTALTECEKYYPVFQYVIWGGKTPEEALEAAMIDTVGEA